MGNDNFVQYKAQHLIKKSYSHLQSVCVYHSDLSTINTQKCVFSAFGIQCSLHKNTYKSSMYLGDEMAMQKITARYLLKILVYRLDSPSMNLTESIKTFINLWICATV